MMDENLLWIIVKLMILHIPWNVLSNEANSGAPPNQNCTVQQFFEKNLIMCTTPFTRGENEELGDYIQVLTNEVTVCKIRGKTSNFYFLSLVKHSIRKFDNDGEFVVSEVYCSNKLLLIKQFCTSPEGIETGCFSIDESILSEEIPTRYFSVVCWHNDIEELMIFARNEEYCFEKNMECMIYVNFDDKKWKNRYYKRRYKACSYAMISRKDMEEKCFAEVQYRRINNKDIFSLAQYENIKPPLACTMYCKTGSFPVMTGAEYQFDKTNPDNEFCRSAICSQSEIISYSYRDNSVCIKSLIFSKIPHICHFVEFALSESQIHVTEKTFNFNNNETLNDWICTENSLVLQRCQPLINDGQFHIEENNNWRFKSLDNIIFCHSLSSFDGLSPEQESTWCEGKFSEFNIFETVIITSEETTEPLMGILTCNGRNYDVVSGSKYHFKKSEINAASCTKLIFKSKAVIYENSRTNTQQGAEENYCNEIQISVKIFTCVLSCDNGEEYILVSFVGLNKKCMPHISCKIMNCIHLNTYYTQDSVSDDIYGIDSPGNNFLQRTLTGLTLSNVDCGRTTTTTQSTRRRNKAREGNPNLVHSKYALANHILDFTEYITSPIQRAMHFIEKVIIRTAKGPLDNREMYMTSSKISLDYRHLELRSLDSEAVSEHNLHSFHDFLQALSTPRLGIDLESDEHYLHVQATEQDICIQLPLGTYYYCWKMVKNQEIPQTYTIYKEDTSLICVNKTEDLEETNCKISYFIEREFFSIELNSNEMSDVLVSLQKYIASKESK